MSVDTIHRTPHDTTAATATTELTAAVEAATAAASTSRPGWRSAAAAPWWRCASTRAGPRLPPRARPAPPSIARLATQVRTCPPPLIGGGAPLGHRMFTLLVPDVVYPTVWVSVGLL